MSNTLNPQTGLSVRDLACVRGGRRLFEGLAFDLAPGDALVLRGPNGSGKSSLLRLLAGLLPAEFGDVLWHGQPVAKDREAWRTSLRFLGHDNAVKPTLSVAQNLDFWISLYPQTPGNRRTQGLAAMGLDHLADLPAVMLSAGQRRRLALARLAASPGDVWLLDEPTVTLDSDSIARLTDMVVAHRATGGIVVAATHDGFGAADATRLDLGGTP